jgi:[protein-PII] uridylyltransferase
MADPAISIFDPRVPTSEATGLALAERASWVDAIAAGAFLDAIDAELGDHAAAIAVGGYGRRELFPHSAIDILILVREDLPASTVRGPVGRFVQKLWDARLRLSHSVRTIPECCELYEQNVELSISLLDARPLCGSSALADELLQRLPGFYRVQHDSIARHLARLTRIRYSKFQNTIYHLEPDVKDGPGGIRDLQVVRWLAKLQGADSNLDEALSAARAFLFPLRYFLHTESRRDNNTLNFDFQEALSARPAEMMQQFYRHAREVHRVASDGLDAVEQRDRSLLAQFRDWRSRVSNADFTIRRERVLLRSPHQLGTDASLLFRLFEFSARHGVALAADTERRVSEAAAGPLARPLAAGGWWRDLRATLSQPRSSLALRAMVDTAALQAVVPEWKNIDCLVVRDFYHRYTVDEHTLVALERLENIEDANFRDLMSEIDQPEVLKFAVLMHDIGKGHGNHVQESTVLARNVAERLGLPEGDRDTALFLVERHLDLSSAMNSRDLSDPATGRLLAAQMGTLERLKLLTMLTYADISAVNPTAMTPWRREQLWRTYLAAYSELTRELDTERVHGAGITVAPDLARFVEGFPTRYIRTHNEAEIRKHRELAVTAEQRGVAASLARKNGFYEVCVAAGDHPFLFASICGALASFGMNIVKAEAFSNQDNVILDTFTFADPNRTLELNPSERERLEDTIVRAVSGRADVKRMLQNRRPPARSQRVRPRVVFSNEASQHATLVEIVAEDRPGLLYDLSTAMSQAGCNIGVVLIDTEARRALDVFYVTAEGAKLNEEAQAQLRTALLAVCGE